eukprot:COSAG02_NODE_257_length_26838_cov_118.324844_5_plen_311_part_00
MLAAVVVGRSLGCISAGIACWVVLPCWFSTACVPGGLCLDRWGREGWERGRRGGLLRLLPLTEQRSGPAVRPEGGAFPAMSMGGTGKFGYSTRDPLSRYLDPPGRPDSFIGLSQSGKNFLTSDKYLDGAKRRHFPEPPQGIAIADVNYGIYKQPPPAPKPTDGSFIYDKEEVVLPGALVAPCSWRPVAKPELNNPFMMTPTQRRILLKQQKAANEARVYNQTRTHEVVRREYIMRHSYPHGVMGIDAPVPGSKVYADKAAEIARVHTASRNHAQLRRQSALATAVSLSACSVASLIVCSPARALFCDLRV